MAKTPANDPLAGMSPKEVAAFNRAARLERARCRKIWDLGVKLNQRDLGLMLALKTALPVEQAQDLIRIAADEAAFRKGERPDTRNQPFAHLVGAAFRAAQQKLP